MQFRWVRTGNTIIQDVDLIRERREFMIYSSASNVGELIEVWAAKSFEARGMSVPPPPLLSELLTHFDHHCSGIVNGEYWHLFTPKPINFSVSR
jgi:hypothetical protein